jgi:hypothetical protein
MAQRAQQVPQPQVHKARSTFIAPIPMDKKYIILMKEKLTATFADWFQMSFANLCMMLKKSAARAGCVVASCVSNGQLMNKVALANFKGLSQKGQREKITKNLPNHPFRTTYPVMILSARSRSS